MISFCSITPKSKKHAMVGVVFIFLSSFIDFVGAAHCQIIDALYPGVVPLHKVKFNATEEYEMVSNFKILQECFHKIGIEKVCND
jgi:hypothetical protein